MLPNRPPLKEWASIPFDVIIIGGGINGAGVARDAVLRGFRVALFEQSDYASGTSSRSSKLIHGGIRYLEQGRLGLVFEASRERHTLLRIAPHLARPLPFIFPVYRGTRGGMLRLRIGMLLYDLLSLFRTIRPHRMLDPEETLRLEPALSPDGLIGSAFYYDGQMNDSRLCLANILEARSLGAAVRNYTQVTGLIKEEGNRIAGVRVCDRLSREEASIRGSVVVNAAGVWVDEVCRMESAGAGPKIRKTRGSHLILPSLTRNAVVIRNPRDGRVLFVIPWEGMSLVGTTDVDDPADPSDVHCTPGDRDYILAETRRCFPQCGITPDQVIATFAGLRPLAESGESLPSAVSRESRIDESKPGMISITGGKFTTYRKIAEEVTDRIRRRLPDQSAGRCLTSTRPLWGGEIENLENYLKEKTAELGRSDSLDPAQVDHLIKTFGTHHASVIHLMREDPSLGERLHPALPNLKAEVVYAVRQESAVMLADVLRRRSTIALGPYRTDETVLRATIALMAAELGWSPEEIRKQREEYRTEIL
jgi:glycerol-3-phosphate dehydrogenase